MDGAGATTADFPGSPREGAAACAVDTSGKIVVASLSGNVASQRFLLMRFNANGSVDSSFGIAGFSATDFPGSQQAAAADVAIAADGKIVVAGTVDQVVTVVRYGANGVMDGGFGGGDGIVQTNVGTADVTRSVAVDASGKITTLSMAVLGSGTQLGVARFTAQGVLDPSFSTDGKFNVWFPQSGAAVPAGLALDSNGRTIVGGVSVDRLVTPNAYSLVAARLTPSGQLDTTFSGDGKAVAPVQASFPDVTRVDAGGLALGTDDKIVVAGTFHSPDPGDGSVRFTSSGEVDPSHGMRHFHFTGVDAFVFGLTLDSSNRPILAGGTLPP